MGYEPNKDSLAVHVQTWIYFLKSIVIYQDPTRPHWLSVKHLHLSALVPLSGKAPIPRPGFQMPEPDGCSSYFFGLPIPDGVRFLSIFSLETESVLIENI